MKIKHFIKYLILLEEFYKHENQKVEIKHTITDNGLGIHLIGNTNLGYSKETIIYKPDLNKIEEYKLELAKQLFYPKHIEDRINKMEKLINEKQREKLSNFLLMYKIVNIKFDKNNQRHVNELEKCMRNI